MDFLHLIYIQYLYNKFLYLSLPAYILNINYLIYKYIVGVKKLISYTIYIRTQNAEFYLT